MEAAVAAMLASPVAESSSFTVGGSSAAAAGSAGATGAYPSGVGAASGAGEGFGASVFFFFFSAFLKPTTFFGILGLGGTRGAAEVTGSEGATAAASACVMGFTGGCVADASVVVGAGSFPAANAAAAAVTFAAATTSSSPNSSNSASTTGFDGALPMTSISSPRAVTCWLSMSISLRCSPSSSNSSNSSTPVAPPSPSAPPGALRPA